MNLKLRLDRNNWSWDLTEIVHQWSSEGNTIERFVICDAGLSKRGDCKTRAGTRGPRAWRCATSADTSSPPRTPSRCRLSLRATRPTSRSTWSRRASRASSRASGAWPPPTATTLATSSGSSCPSATRAPWASPSNSRGSRGRLPTGSTFNGSRTGRAWLQTCRFGRRCPRCRHLPPRARPPPPTRSPSADDTLVEEARLGLTRVSRRRTLVWMTRNRWMDSVYLRLLVRDLLNWSPSSWFLLKAVYHFLTIFFEYWPSPVTVCDGTILNG